MALPPPNTPADWQAAVPAPSDPVCDANARVFSRIPTQLSQFFSWAQATDGSISPDFKEWGGGVSTTGPQNLTASDGRPDDVFLTWQGVGGANFYEVWRGVTADVTAMTLLPGGSAVTGTSFTDTTAAAGTQLFYAVRASTAAGFTEYSNIAPGRRATSSPGGGGGAPLSIVDTQSGIAITATVPAGATRMKVELWAAGGRGGGAAFAGFQQIRPGVQQPVWKGTGGGGAGGSYWSLDDIVVAEGEVFTLAAATSDGGLSYASRDGDGLRASLAVMAKQSGGYAQQVGATTLPGAAGEAVQAGDGSVTNTFAGGVPVFIAGADGGAGSSSSTIVLGGAAVTVDGRSAGRGGGGNSAGRPDGAAGLAPSVPGANGRVHLVFS